MRREITEDEFERWKSHPITKWVFDAVEMAADAQKRDWELRSWEGGEANPMALTELRTRADAYRALFETTYDQWKAMHEPADA